MAHKIIHIRRIRPGVWVAEWWPLPYVMRWAALFSSWSNAMEAAMSEVEYPTSAVPSMGEEYGI